MRDRLERYNYTVFTVEDYSNIKAEFIEIKPPHLVLLDINLPSYDGFFSGAGKLGPYPMCLLYLYQPDLQIWTKLWP